MNADRVNMYLLENKEHIIDHGPFYYGHEISLTIRRLDPRDTISGGNKWFKLKYNLEKYKRGKYSGLLTFGGAWSNHLAAVARAGKLSGINTIGIVRGEPVENITMKRAASDGMQLYFVSRNDYGKRDHPDYFRNLIPGFENCFIVPEGGSNAEGVKGCMEILNDDDNSYTDIVLACGTGATAAGLLLSMLPHQHLTGISILKDGGSIEKNMENLLLNFTKNIFSNWHIEHEFHGGGYAKTNKELENFISDFKKRTSVETEPVYTGKLFYAIENLIRNGKFSKGSRILTIHTGGLQYLDSRL